MMKGNKYLLTILTFIQSLHFCTSQKLTFDRNVAIEPIGNGSFIVHYGDVLDEFDYRFGKNYRKTDIKSVSLYASEKKILGRVMR